MNLDKYNFNVPAFVRDAAPDSFDANAVGAVVVGGLRIDNPAAAWVAGAELRKHAASLDNAVSRMIKQACSLFNLGEDMFTERAFSPTVSISDGVNTAEFNIYDSDSLNKAASALLNRRDSVPYSFAHDCAVALQEEAVAQGLSFNNENIVPIRKLAGDYNVDFVAGRELLNRAVKQAEANGMTAHAEVLSKIASLCTEDCSPSAAPYFIVALDEFRSGLRELRKSASADFCRPEDVFYVSTAEFLDKKASEKLEISDGISVTAGKLGSAAANISKWASVCGYSIPYDATPEDIAKTVAKMPSALRDEFVELFA